MKSGVNLDNDICEIIEYSIADCEVRDYMEGEFMDEVKETMESNFPYEDRYRCFHG